ncbi:MAG: hypothetical protein WC326_04575 [Candidatus Delongbacteria bacterium]
MKHATWLAGLLVLSTGVAHAATRATVDAQLVPAPSSDTPVVALEATSLAAPHRQAITTLHAERQAFVQAFDWQAGESQALRREFNAALARFDLRELELKRDWYAASGQTDLLARTEEALAKRLQPASAQPEIVTERLPQPVAPSPEATR